MVIVFHEEVVWLVAGGLVGWRVVGWLSSDQVVWLEVNYDEAYSLRLSVRVENTKTIFIARKVSVKIRYCRSAAVD